MNGERPPITKAQVHDRLRRYAALRAAQRAVAPAVRFPDPLPLSAEEDRQLRAMLAGLITRVDSADGEEAAPTAASPRANGDLTRVLRDVDTALTRFAQRLLGTIDRIPLSEVRATLPELTEQNRAEVAALLDLSLSEPESSLRRFGLIDYLVTRLASETQGGIRRIVTQPSEVSPGVREMCAGVDQYRRPAHEEAAQLFRDAAAEATQLREIDSLVERMRAVKSQYADCLFASAVLDSMVGYNIAVTNRIQSLLEEDRSRDATIQPDAQAAPARSAHPPTGDAPVDEAPAPAVISVFEAPGVLAVAAAIRDHVTGRTPPPGAAADFATKVEVSNLGEWARRALLSDRAKESEALARAMVAVGAIADAVLEQPTLLAASELNIEPATLSDHWLPELETRVRELTRDLVASNSYDEARHLSDLKSQFLSALTVARVQAREGVPRTQPLSLAAHARCHDALESAERRLPARTRRAPAGAPTILESVRRAGRWLRGRPIRYAAAAAVALLVIPLVLARAPEPSRVRILPAHELGDVSPHLASGYRDGRSSGSMFIGTLTDKWGALPEAERIESTRAIEKRLSRSGVQEILLFDGRRRLQVHVRAGRIEYLARPAG